MVFPLFEKAVGVQNSPGVWGSRTSRVWASWATLALHQTDFENKKTDDCFAVLVSVEDRTNRLVFAPLRPRFASSYILHWSSSPTT